jgi:hypothetical protein
MIVYYSKLLEEDSSTVHMVFHYIKIQEFEKAFKVLQDSYLLLLELDNSRETIDNFLYLGQVCEELNQMADMVGNIHLVLFVGLHGYGLC